MAEKHVAVCDYCGKEEPLVDVGHQWFTPARWLFIGSAPTGSVSLSDLAHFCSWECVAQYAVVQRAEEDRCAHPPSA